jgi:lipid-A-disaccharide synthase
MVDVLPRHLNGHYGMCPSDHLVSNASRDFLKKVFYIAGEASGDIYGGLIAREMLSLSRLSNIGCIEMRGWGGDQMTDAGVEVTTHYRELAYMGVWEVASNLGTILGNLKKCWEEIEAFKPDAIVLVDFPGFNMRIARKAANAEWGDVKIFQVVAPQVWAWKKGRIKSLARDYTAVFPVLPFEHNLLIAGGVQSIYCGHPLLDTLSTNQDETQQVPTKPVLALLPGSRKQELHKMLPVLLEVAKQFPEMEAVIAGAPGAADTLYIQAREAGVNVVFGQTRNLIKTAKFAVITSGTATLEAALLNTSHVLVYKTSSLTYAIAKLLVNVKFIGLTNLILNREVVPELIQGRCTAGNIAKEIQSLDTSTQRIAFDELRMSLGHTGASERIAQRMLEIISVDHPS